MQKDDTHIIYSVLAGDVNAFGTLLSRYASRVRGVVGRMVASVEDAEELTMMLHGYDLLNQLSNVTQTIDAQGRIETSTNTLHRYILLHLSYKLHKAPKKK